MLGGVAAINQSTLVARSRNFSWVRVGKRLRNAYAVDTDLCPAHRDTDHARPQPTACAGLRRQSRPWRGKHRSRPESIARAMFVTVTPRDMHACGVARA